MSIQPQELATDIFHRLHNCSKDPESVSEFELRRLKADTQRLLEVNAMAGYTALGCIAFLMHDTKAMLENHERAIKLGPYDFHSNVNFAVSLCNTGRYKECCDYSSTAVKIASKGDAYVLEQHCEHLATAGRFIDASNYVSKLLEMKVTPRHADIINEAAKQMRENSLDQDEVSDYLCAASEIMIEHDVYPSGEAMWDFYDETYQFVREVFINVEPEKAAGMNRALSRLVVSKNISEDILLMFSNSFTTGKLERKTSESHGYKVEADGNRV